MASLPDIRLFEIASNTSIDEINRLYQKQQNHIQKARLTPITERIHKLKKLKLTFIRHQAELRQAMYKDYYKPAVEVDLAELVVLLNEINFTIRKLKKWTSKHRVGTPWFLWGANSYIQYEAKGHALVISPWNYPIHLTLMPLVHSYAAGNVTMIKPSEFTPYTTEIVKKITKLIFAEEEACIVEGDASVSTYITHLRFDHIFFTGSPKVGKLIMEAAAKNLTSVTLELGGKSPMIIDQTADLDTAITFAVANKFLNSGQFCVAPDYFFVHENIKNLFIKKFIEQTQYQFGNNLSTLAKSDYCQIINQRQAHRIKSLIADAIQKGATLEYRYGENDDTLVGPILFSNTNSDMLIENEEIFGPICNVKSFKHLNEVIQYIQQGEKPLSLYLFSKDLNTKRRIRHETSAGNMCINTAVINYFNYNLPFGGVNHSGIGKSHGFYSFKEFSNAKSIFNQWWPWPFTLLLFPPFTRGTKRIIEIFTSIFK